MNTTAWIVTGVLAAVFLLAGGMKLARTKAQLVETGQGWAETVPPGLVKLIGLVEVLGALGLVLPGLLDVATWLVPTAAVGLAVTMLGAVVVHGRRREIPNVVVNLVLLAASVFVAVQRFGPQAF